MSRFAKITASIVLPASIYTGYVLNLRSVQPKETKFDIGSTEDRIMDGLSTGDVILFRRKWYNYHIPAAFTIASYRYKYNNIVYDHAGIIIEDTHGTPYLLENTFSGIKLRPYDSRMIYSKAQEIILLPLLPRVDLSNGQRIKAFKLANEYLHENNNKQYHEGKGLMNTIISKDQRCPSTQVIIDMITKLHDQMISSSSSNDMNKIMKCDEFVTSKTIINNKFSFGNPVVLFQNQ